MRSSSSDAPLARSLLLLLRLGAPLPPPISVAVTASAATRTGDGLLDAAKKNEMDHFCFLSGSFSRFLLHEKVTDDEGVPSLVSNLSVQVFYHMKKFTDDGKKFRILPPGKRPRPSYGTDDEGWVRGSP